MSPPSASPSLSNWGLYLRTTAALSVPAQLKMMPHWSLQPILWIPCLKVAALEVALQQVVWTFSIASVQKCLEEVVLSWWLFYLFPPCVGKRCDSIKEAFNQLSLPASSLPLRLSAAAKCRASMGSLWAVCKKLMETSLWRSRDEVRKAVSWLGCLNVSTGKNICSQVLKFCSPTVDLFTSWIGNNSHCTKPPRSADMISIFPSEDLIWS